MSGGSLGYFYGQLEEHVGDFADRELDELVQDLATLFREREWYLSGDKSERAWREASVAFKRKWLLGTKEREYVEQYMDEAKLGMLWMFGLSNEYCRNCKHWMSLEDAGFPYGDCDLVDERLVHGYDTCEKFEVRHEAETF